MVDDLGVPHLQLEMLSQPILLCAARSMVGNLASRIGFNDSDCSQISLAVDEALCNVINHGYKRRPDGVIWLKVWANEETREIVIVIEDRAEQVDPEKIRPRDLDEIRPGGLGVYIIREVMDETHYEKRNSPEGGMRLSMRKQVRKDTNTDAQDTTIQQACAGSKGDKD